MFWLHHGQIDRTWWIWQNQDVAGRALQIGGPRVWNCECAPMLLSCSLDPSVAHQRESWLAFPLSTVGGEDPLGDATIEDLIALGVNGEASPIAEHVSSVGGRYCYIYL